MASSIGAGALWVLQHEWVLQFGYGQGSANSANHHLGRDSSPRRSCLLAVSAARPNGLAKVGLSLLIERAIKGAHAPW